MTLWIITRRHCSLPYLLCVTLDTRYSHTNSIQVVNKQSQEPPHTLLTKCRRRRNSPNTAEAWKIFSFRYFFCFKTHEVHNKRCKHNTRHCDSDAAALNVHARFVSPGAQSLLRHNST